MGGRKRIKGFFKNRQLNRPEALAPPDIFYNDLEARKYSRNSRTIKIQRLMTRRALEMLMLPPGENCLLLDVGCGSGISGDLLAEEGHFWIGVDISMAMLDVAVENEAQENGEMIYSDIGAPVKFRPGCFDGCVSISAIQWLCNADKSSHNPYKRLLCFFGWLRICLGLGCRAVFQFYPSGPEQIEMITSAALRGGFGGGLVIDYPNSTKAKKYFLCLWAGNSIEAMNKLPEARSGLWESYEDADSSEESYEDAMLEDENDSKYNQNDDEYEDEPEDEPEDALPVTTSSRRKLKMGAFVSAAEKSRLKTNQSIDARKLSKHRRAKKLGIKRVSRKQWITIKKEKQRNSGKKVARDSKYSGRKRKDRF